MSQDNGKPLDPIEIASLPPDAPQRMTLERELANLTPLERERWKAEFALTDGLREELSAVKIPADLQARLLAIPGKAARGSKGGVMQMKVNPAMLAAAAAFLIVASLLAYYFFLMDHSTTTAYLDQKVASGIAVSAVKHSTEAATIESSDSETVRKSLEKAGGIGMPVIMLKPDEGTTLEGGGTCDFGPVKAAFTKWKNGASNYTLFQFDGKKLGTPAMFYAKTSSPTELWHDSLQYTVFIFPGAGGKCCWALVMENKDAKNVFAHCVGY